MNHKQARALAERLFVRACLGNLQVDEYQYGKCLLYLVSCHATHADLRGFGGSIDDLSWESGDKLKTTRAHLRRLAHLARAARTMRLRPNPALERDRAEMRQAYSWAFSPIPEVSA